MIPSYKPYKNTIPVWNLKSPLIFYVNIYPDFYISVLGVTREATKVSSI